MTYKNFTVETDSDGIALVTWDMPGKSMNVIDQGVVEDLNAIVDAMTGDDSIKGVVLTSGKDSFSAGADLSMLEGSFATYQKMKQSDPEGAAKFLFENSSWVQRICRRLETSGKTWVAAINGVALGGGFELCLACHGRVMAEHPKAKVGLPEVKVGLFPGGGGTQRVPRLIDTQEALQMLLQGKNYDAAKAKKVGLVHEAVAPKNLIAAAKKMILDGLKPVQPWDEKGFRIPGGPVYSAKGAQLFPPASAIYRRETYDNYPGARCIMKCVYEGLLLPMDAALRVESRYFAHVLTTTEAGMMIRSLFLSKQELDKGARRPADVPPAKIRKVGILGGGGFMGAGIGYVTAKAGIKVVILDRDAESAAKGKAHSQGLEDKAIARGRSTPEARDKLLSLIETTTDYAALSDCDLVIEAVFEDSGIKKIVTEEAAKHMKRSAIFASNTSTIPITGLAKNFPRQKQFIGIHFFSPVDRMMLTEIIMGKRTGDKALAVALDYVRAIRKTPIVVNDTRGFYINRMVLLYMSEAYNMLIEGIPPAMIENVAKMAGMPVGPLALNDETAIDLSHKIMHQTVRDLGEKAVDSRHLELVDRMVEEYGRFGRKNGKGFYDYPAKPAKKHLWPGAAELYPQQDPDTIDVQEMRNRYHAVIALEAARCVEQGVVTDMREADVGSILGFGFAPFTGGAISYIDGMGTTAFVEMCKKLQKKYGKQFKPNKLLLEMAKTDEKFYERFNPKPEAARKQAA
ncbi:MAG: 3-hydroxyacyl-CoA dehydrogenase NAD-binding domain-containing protein [Pseudomonadota bacterium]|nr:3-hydroxyacyl-CoA dehydrogenase NAD-binding domain-containing protein [Pseudomonadota bacterium]